MFVYVRFALCLCRDWFCGLTWERVYYIYERFLSVLLRITEFDCPEVVPVMLTVRLSRITDNVQQSPVRMPAAYKLW